MAKRGRTHMNILKQPSWLRGLEILAGLFAMVVGVMVFAFPGWGVSTLVFLLSIGLIIVGIRSISLVGYSGLPRGLRAVSTISGIISLILAGAVLIFPSYGVLTLMVFVSFGLLIYGVSRIFLAYSLKSTISGLRDLIVAVGAIDVILSVLVLVLPSLALLTFAVILALAFLVSGAEMIVSGAIGRTWLGEMVKAIREEMGEG